MQLDSHDSEDARRNRKRCNEDYGREFYLAQEHAVGQWDMACPKPKSVILGVLPYAGKISRRIEQSD